MVDLLEQGGVEFGTELAEGVVAEGADLVGGFVHDVRGFLEGVLLNEVEGCGFAGLWGELGENGQQTLAVFLVEKGVGGVDGVGGKGIRERGGVGFSASCIEGEVDGGTEGVGDGIAGVAKGA
jgi:hypothetical protein